MIDQDRYLCFNLGKEEFALPLLKVKEVIGVPDITPVPQASNYFLGIMNLRGLIISLIDLRVKMGIKPLQSEETAVIILELGDYNLGIMVDQVNSVVRLSEQDFSEKPMLDNSKINDCVTGIFRKSEQLVLLLDIAKALSLEDKNTLQKITKPASAQAA